MARILIVDDHPTNRMLLTTLMGYGGHTSLEAGDGAEALARVGTFHPDLVITDVLMPTMDGVTFVKRLRQDPRWKDLPVLFHTATYRMPEARILADSCGVLLVIPKPCAPQELLDAVQLALGLPRFKARPVPEEAPGPLDWPAALDHLAAPQEVAGDSIQATLGRMESVSLRLVALLKASMESAGERSPEALLTKFCHTARDVVSARFAMLGILGENGQGQSRLITHGLPEGPRGEMPEQGGFLRRLLEDGRPVRVRAFGEDPAIWGLPPGTPGFQSLLAIPLTSPRRTFGWLYLADRLGSEMFTDEDESLASALGAQLALAYENLQLLESLRGEIELRGRTEGARRNLLEILNSIDEVAWSLDIPGQKPLAISSACQRVFGYPAEDFMADANLWDRMIHPLDRPAVRDFMEHLAAGAAGECEYRVLHKEWALRWIRTRAKPHRDANGQVVRADGISSDITEQHAAQEALRKSEMRFRSLVESVDDLVCTLDPGLRVTGLYGRGTHWLEGRGAAILGMRLSEVLPPALATSFVEQCARILNDGPSSFEVSEIQDRCFQVSAAPIQEGSGEAQGLVAVVRDLTEFLRMRERLSQQDRLAALGTLVGTVAHDVRNPLLGVLASLDVLEFGPGSPETSRSALANLRTSAERISSLMNELLDYAKPRPLQSAPLSVAPLVKDVIQACAILAARKGVEIQASLEDGSQLLHADAQRLHQVILNLTENAIQHSPPHGTVRLIAALDPEGFWALEVRDQGKGISPQDLPRVFDPFFSRRPGGTGLGLAISQRFAQLHGGFLEASNLPDGGATFRLRLPLG